MAFIIKDISNTHPTDFKFYFLDSNVLINYFQYERSGTPNSKQKYSDFVSTVINLNFVAKSDDTPRPKFILTSLLLSEFFNAYMRQVSIKTYAAKLNVPVDSVDYKRNFRPSETYSKELKQLISDLDIWNVFGCTELLDDDFKALNPFSEILPNLDSKSDFNDYYFYALLKNRKDTAIVTDDADFAFENLPIITSNSKLLRLSKK